MPDTLPSAAAALLAIALAFPAPASAAGASPWSDDHASRARLVAGGVEADGARWAGIEIEMETGFKTYWRTPGESGIPPELDWSGSQNVADVVVEWPAPDRFEDPFGAYFGYLEHVVWPVRVTPQDPDAPVRLSLAMFYGVCKDICIPAQGAAELDLPAEPIASDATVSRAREAVPIAVAPGEAHGGLSIHSVSAVDPQTFAVRIEAPDDALLFAEGPSDAWFLAPEARMERSDDGGGVFMVEIAAVPRDAREAGSFPVRLTLVSGDAAIETKVMLER